MYLFILRESKEGRSRDRGRERETESLPSRLRVVGTELFKKFFFSTFIYFWDRERQSTNGGGAEREGDTELETGSRL